MPSRAAAPEGFIHSLRRLGANVIGLVADHARLVSLELAEEKQRLLQLLVWTAAVMLAGLLTVIFITATLVVLLWKHFGVGALGAFALLYLIAFAVLALAFRSYLRRQPAPFAGLVDELQQDRSWINPGS